MMRRMSRAAVLPLIAVVGLAATFESIAAPAVPSQPPGDRSAWRWYKGNTHTHTLESDGDSTPDEVTRWYKERGYHFLVLSDHNVLTPIAELASAHAVPEQFLLVPGEEVTDDFAQKPLHINGLNVDRLVEPQHGASVTETLQRNVDAIRAARGVPHINHPNFGWAIAPAELAALERYRLLEIYNGHPTGEQPRRRRPSRARGGVGPAARRRPARLRHRRRRRPLLQAAVGCDGAATRPRLGGRPRARGSRRRRS